MNRQDRAKKFLAGHYFEPQGFTPGILHSFPNTCCNNSKGIFSRRCTVYHRDDTWPIDLGHLISDSLITFNLEATRRLIYLGPFFALSNILGLSSLLTKKSLFIFTRLIIGFLPYRVTYKFLSSKLGDIHKNRIFAVSLIAGFFYAYNPFVTEKFGA